MTVIHHECPDCGTGTYLCRGETPRTAETPAMRYCPPVHVGGHRASEGDDTVKLLFAKAKHLPYFIKKVDQP